MFAYSVMYTSVPHVGVFFWTYTHIVSSMAVIGFYLYICRRNKSFRHFNIDIISPQKKYIDPISRQFSSVFLCVARGKIMNFPLSNDDDDDNDGKDTSEDKKETRLDRIFTPFTMKEKQTKNYFFGEPHAHTLEQS